MLKSNRRNGGIVTGGDVFFFFVGFTAWDS